VTWHIAIKRSVRRAVKKNPLGRVKEKLEKDKASVRAKVEHPLHVLKNLFRHRKTRYRRLAKNAAQLYTLFTFANLMLAGKNFGSAQARAPSSAVKRASRKATTPMAAPCKFEKPLISAIVLPDADLRASN
jgi:IS5 family transposase